MKAGLAGDRLGCLNYKGAKNIILGIHFQEPKKKKYIFIYNYKRECKSLCVYLSHSLLLKSPTAAISDLENPKGMFVGIPTSSLIPVGLSNCRLIRNYSSCLN